MVGLHPASATHHAAVANRCHEGAGQPTSQPTNLRSISPSAVPRSVEIQPPSRPGQAFLSRWPQPGEGVFAPSVPKVGTDRHRGALNRVSPLGPHNPLPRVTPDRQSYCVLPERVVRFLCPCPKKTPKAVTHAPNPPRSSPRPKKKNCTDIDDLHFQLHVIHPSHHSAPRSQAESSRPLSGWLLVGQARNSAQKTQHNP